MAKFTISYTGQPLVLTPDVKATLKYGMALGRVASTAAQEMAAIIMAAPSKYPELLELAAQITPIDLNAVTDNKQLIAMCRTRRKAYEALTPLVLAEPDRYAELQTLAQTVKHPQLPHDDGPSAA